MRGGGSDSEPFMYYTPVSPPEAYFINASSPSSSSFFKKSSMIIPPVLYNDVGIKYAVGSGEGLTSYPHKDVSRFFVDKNLGREYRYHAF